MERAAREALRDFLESCEESVGTDVNIEYLGCAPLGVSVRGVAKVTAIEGRGIRFEVTAWVGDRLIGRGTHARAIIECSQFTVDRRGARRKIQNVGIMSYG